ncbi:MAG: hypothetical protein GAK29_00886 [Acinetobacter bereziniae]|uniref:Uncharacterized protein n=1 Tax=Acinetobacter bereziniae TaxID=106648 RepID=A0A833PHB3_ACIBZ|nr:MAG: hypothetical protein GAK29_00886 [Acinetobacter bereziniae]
MAKPTTKTSKKNAQINTAPFASFMKLNAEDQTQKDNARAEKEEEWAKKAETDPDREQLEDESDDDYATRMEQMDNEEEQAKKAEGEITEDPEADEEKDDEKAKAVRASERVRCARIIAHGIQSGNVNQAAVLAFDTGLSASQAIAAINASKADVGGSNLGNRMSQVNNHNLGSNVGAGKQFKNRDEATASSILESMKAARG